MSYFLRALDLKVARISNFSAWKVLNVLHRLIIKLHLICVISKMRNFLILYIAVLHLFKKKKQVYANCCTKLRFSSLRMIITFI